ncbi:MAG TPA: hypothetical protein VLC95_12650, partial [Anaerolineae bacterium]|nr:hypothetical protein [Anaerolineae bacterium]
TNGQQDTNGEQDGQAGAAQQRTGATAAQALAFDGTWRELNPGEVHWYAFQYDGSFETQEVDDEDADDGETESVFVPTDIVVWADSTPDDSINFAVWTRNNIDASGQFDVDTLGTDLAAQPQDGTGPVGFDAECEEVDGDVCWAGTFHEAGVYYIRVSHDPAFGQQTVSYRLGIEGDDVRTDLFGTQGLAGQQDTNGQLDATNGQQDVGDDQDVDDDQQDLNGDQDADDQQDTADLVSGQASIAPRRADRDAAQDYTFDTIRRELDASNVELYTFQFGDTTRFEAIGVGGEDEGDDSFFAPSYSGQ